MSAVPEVPQSMETCSTSDLNVRREEEEQQEEEDGDGEA
jgi:hypothetical protein